MGFGGTRLPTCGAPPAFNFSASLGGAAGAVDFAETNSADKNRERLGGKDNL